MFRESDIREKNPHKINQPLPLFQNLAINSRFDEGSDQSISSSRVQNIVPTTYDTRIDPDHPNADWQGLVLKDNQRKHTNDHISQQRGIHQTEHGIVSIDEKVEWLQKRRDGSNPATSSVPLIGGVMSGKILLLLLFICNL